MEGALSCDRVPTTSVASGDLELECAAIEILFREDPEEFDRLKTDLPGLGALKEWSDGQVKQIVEAAYSARSCEMEREGRRFMEVWQPRQSAWYGLMDELLGRPGWASLPCFLAIMGLAPISTRSIARQTFLVPVGSGEASMIEIAAHETCHFYFYGSLEGSGRWSRRELNHRKAIWIASELVVSVLGATPQALEVLGFRMSNSYAEQIVGMGAPPDLVHRLSNGEIGSLALFDELVSRIADRQSGRV